MIPHASAASFRCMTATAVLAALLAGGCASSGYLADRGRDAADIFTLGLGTGVGIKARVGPVQAAVIENCDLFGLRCGHFVPDGNALLENREVFTPIPLQSPFALWREQRSRRRAERLRQIRAGHSGVPGTNAPPAAAVSPPPGTPDFEKYPQFRPPPRRSPWRTLCGRGTFAVGVTEQARADGRYVDEGSPFPLVVVGDTPSGYTQIEVAAGMILTVRAGVNPGELLDFLVGWVGMDLYGDDRRRIPAYRH